MRDLKSITQILAFSFPDLEKSKPVLKKINLTDLPFWLQSSVELYYLPVSEFISIGLISFKKEVTFDQLLMAYRKLMQNFGKVPLLINANSLPAGYRPLFVKFRVSFITNEIIFAPRLFMITNELSRYKKINFIDGFSSEKTLSAFSIKIVSAYLTKIIDKKIKQNDFHKYLIKQESHVSLSKLSLVLKELVEFDFMEIIGKGPEKEFLFKSMDEVWKNLLSCPKSKLILRLIETYFYPMEKNHIIAGEAALVEYTTLSMPQYLTIAINSNLFRELESKRQPLKSQDTCILIQIWKEDPKLFSINGKINPIELYLSMQKIDDERIQIAFDQLLREYGLTIKREEV